jgi:spore coat polysaccharide biosynthesis predicted glycosyltransferase SpsG
LLLAADVGIISGGTLSYEACAVGLPTLLVCMADNQAINVAAWTRLGTSIDLGPLETLETSRVQRVLNQVAEPGQLKSMSMNALTHVDGRGAERVVREMTLERDL